MELKDIIAQQQALQQQQAATSGAATALSSGSLLKGAASGAKVGSAAGPYGAIIGGVIGGASGLLKGESSKRAAQEELSNMEVQNNVLENQRLNLQNATSTEFKMGGELTRFKGEDHAKGGIRIGKDEVEGEETMLDDYIFSNYLSPKGSKKTFAELSKKVDDEYYRKNDKFSEASKQARYASLRGQQDEINSKYTKAEDVPKQFRCGGKRGVGKDVMGRKYIMGGSLGEKYERGGPWRNVEGLNAEQSFTEAGIPYTDRTRFEFEKSARSGGLLPNYGVDNVFGAEYNNALNSGLGSGQLSNLTVPSELQGLSAPSLSSTPELSINTPPELATSDLGEVSSEVGADSSGGKFSKAGAVGGSLVQALPGLIAMASNFKTADKVNYGTVQAQTVDPNLLDPRRALQEVGTAFSGANEQLGGLQGGQYLSNRIASAAAEANARGRVAQKYDEANAQILNRTDLSNASARSQANLVNLQQATQQTQDRLQATGQGYQELSKATGAVLGAYNTNQRDAKMLPFVGTENYPVYMGKDGEPTLDFEASRDGVNYNQNIIGKSKKKK